MFTGIISDLGRVRRVRRGAMLDIAIATGFDTATIALGASIACSGACLTVVAVEPGAFLVQASEETLAHTTIGDWREGSPVNLERALRLGDELGGHLVAGHVDGIGRIRDRRPDQGSVRLTIEAPEELASSLAPKGSIAVDGISLTVNEVAAEDAGGCCFGVNIIPHTLAVTSLGEARPGQRVNLEADLIARYVASALAARGRGAGRA